MQDTFSIEVTPHQVFQIFRSYGRWDGDDWIIMNSNGKFMATNYGADGGIRFYNVTEASYTTAEEMFRLILDIPAPPEHPNEKNAVHGAKFVYTDSDGEETTYTLQKLPDFELWILISSYGSYWATISTTALGAFTSARKSFVKL